jgi:hypothetical protein
MLLKYEQITIELRVILNLLLQQFASDAVFISKYYILWWDFKVSSMCGTCTSSSRQEKNLEIFLFKSFGVWKINGLAVPSNKLKNNFTGLVINVLGLDVAREPPF